VLNKCESARGDEEERRLLQLLRNEPPAGFEAGDVIPASAAPIGAEPGPSTAPAASGIELICCASGHGAQQTARAIADNILLQSRRLGDASRRDAVAPTGRYAKTLNRALHVDSAPGCWWSTPSRSSTCLAPRR